MHTISKKPLQRMSFMTSLQLRYDTSLQSTADSETPSSVYEARSKLLERALQVLKVRYGELEAETASIRQQLSNSSTITNINDNNKTLALEEALRVTQSELMETRARLASRDQLWLEAKEKIIVVLNEASRLRSINNELNDNLTESQVLTKESQLMVEEMKVTIAALTAEKKSAQEEMEQLKRNHAIQENERQTALQLISQSTTEGNNNQLQQQQQQQNQEFMQQAASLIATVAEQRAAGVDYLIASDLKEQRKLLQRQGELLESLMDKVSSIDSPALIKAAGIHEEKTVASRKRSIRPSSEREGMDDNDDYMYNNIEDDRDRNRDNYRNSKSRRAELGRRSGRFVRGVGEFAGIVVKSTVDILGFWVGLGVLDDDNDDEETEAERKRRNWSPANVVAPQALPDVDRGTYTIEESEHDTVFPEQYGQTDNYSRYYQKE